MNFDVPNCFCTSVCAFHCDDVTLCVTLRTQFSTRIFKTLAKRLLELKECFCCNRLHGAFSTINIHSTPTFVMCSCTNVDLPVRDFLADVLKFLRYSTLKNDEMLQSRAKIMRLFTFLAILKYVGLPPAPMINVGKSGLNFLFSVIHTTLNWG